MLGAIAGDIVGSVYEFRPIKTKQFEPLFHPRAKITDDTICTLAIADALLRDADPAQVLRAWCREYWAVGGWGKKFIRWVASDTAGPYGSFGNGAAMRVSPVAWLATSLEHAVDLARRVTEITHDHPEGIKAGEATAAAIWLARQGAQPARIADLLASRWGYEVCHPVDDIRPGYQRTEAAADSVPQALACALQADGFEDALRNAVSLGGDADTMAAIAGSVAEALFGVPDDIRLRVEGFLDQRMLEVYRHHPARPNSSRPSCTLLPIAPPIIRPRSPDT
jgi:ADP-ribosylglycohydrolase